MTTEHTTAVVQRYLDALAGDQPAEPIVRALRRLTLPPLNLQPDEMLSAVVKHGKGDITKAWESGHN